MCCICHCYVSYCIFKDLFRYTFRSTHINQHYYTVHPFRSYNVTNKKSKQRLQSCNTLLFFGVSGIKNKGSSLYFFLKNSHTTLRISGMLLRKHPWKLERFRWFITPLSNLKIVHITATKMIAKDVRLRNNDLFDSQSAIITVKDDKGKRNTSM